jgi:hypothetical protein
MVVTGLLREAAAIQAERPASDDEARELNGIEDGHPCGLLRRSTNEASAIIGKKRSLLKDVQSFQLQ